MAGDNLWFAEHVGNNIASITTDGFITEYPLSAAKSAPRFITQGPDGALWFTEYNANRIGRITTTGSISEFPLPNGGHPQSITVGPDKNIWFTETTANMIGCIARDRQQAS